MTAIDDLLTINREVPADDPSAAQAEFVRHRLDLRIYTLLTLFAAILVAYCGFCLSGIVNMTLSGEPRWVAVMPTDLSSFGVLAFSIAISVLCLLEARESWRQASAHIGPTTLSPKPFHRVEQETEHG
jgi:hypothetical protein